jgi:alpha-glucosidase
VPFERLQDPYGLAFWPEFKGRDGARTPMPWVAEAGNGGFSAETAETWLPVSALHLPLAVDRQALDPQSMLNFSRSLLQWRRSQPLLREGSMRFLEAPEPFLCLERRQDEAALQAIFNLSDSTAQLRLPQMLVPLPGSPFLGARHGGELMLELPPYGVFMGAPIDAAAA